MRGFLTPSLGPSDEWVTAHAARALLHTNEERFADHAKSD